MTYSKLLIEILNTKIKKKLGFFGMLIFYEITGNNYKLLPVIRAEYLT